MIDECRVGQDLKISGGDLIDVLFLQFRLEELRKPTRMAGVLAKIRAEHLQNTFLECCLLTGMHVALGKFYGNATDALKNKEKNAVSGVYQIVVI